MRFLPKYLLFSYILVCFLYSALRFFVSAFPSPCHSSLFLSAYSLPLLKPSPLDLRYLSSSLFPDPLPTQTDPVAAFTSMSKFSHKDGSSFQFLISP